MTNPPVSHSLYVRAAVCLKTSHLTFFPPGTHLIRSFGGHLIAPIPLFPHPKRQVKSQGCLSWDNLLRECAIFPSSWIIIIVCFFSAQLPPRRAALFYLIQDAAKHVTKSRMESPKFMILSSLPEMPTLFQLDGDSWRGGRKSRLEKNTQGERNLKKTGRLALTFSR